MSTRLREVTTTRFADLIFNDIYHRVIIDHIFYSHNATDWVSTTEVKRETAGGTAFWKVFDHFHVVAEITPPAVNT